MGLDIRVEKRESLHQTARPVGIGHRWPDRLILGSRSNHNA